MNHARRRHFILACVTSLTLAGALISPELAHAGKGGGKGEAKITKLCESIGCTQKQAETMRTVMKQMHLDIKPDREAIRDLRGQMASEWKSDKPDERKLARLADKIAAHERNIADRRLEAMLELHPILSAEQREAVAARLLKAGGKSRG